MSQQIHISDVRTFRQCRRKWNWTSLLRENLEAIAPYPPFFTGKAVHAALEFYYRNTDTFDETLQKYFKEEEENLAKLGALWPDEVAKIQEQISLIEGLMEHYPIWQAQDKTKYSDANLEFIDMEIDFEVPLLDGATFAGRMDGLVRHKPTGELWIWEAKTARSVQELLNSLANDEQSGMYLWAARQLYDEPIKGVLFNVMRKKAPSVPKFISDGSLSKATSIDTTSYFYAHCVKELHGWKEDEMVEEYYGDILDYLRVEKDQKFFIRYPVYRTQTELDNLVTNIRATAKEMLDLNTPAYPCPSWNTCNFCSFRSPCITMNSGGNAQSLLDAEYQVRESHKSMRSSDDDDA